MVVNITFLSFLQFSMCQSMNDAVNTWINCSFFTLIKEMNERMSECMALILYNVTPEENAMHLSNITQHVYDFISTHTVT